MSLFNLFHQIVYLFKRLISPPFCANCKLYLDDYYVFCSKCLELIKPIISKDIYLKADHKLTVLAVSDYKDPLRSLTLSKFTNSLSSILQLAQIIWRLSALKNLDFDYLVPIPLHWTRKLWRGYNQSEIIANELSKLSGKPVLHCLMRIKRTEYQASLNSDERETNLKRAFGLKFYDDKIAGKTFVLVDDIMTTGSTLKSAANELMRYKPKNLYAVVACRVC